MCPVVLQHLIDLIGLVCFFIAFGSIHGINLVQRCASSVRRYTKTANMPGGKFLKLDTVFVDVTKAAANTTEQVYQTMTIFSCLHAVATVTEVVFATRMMDTPPAVLTSMEGVARAHGVQWQDSSLMVVNRTADGC